MAAQAGLIDLLRAQLVEALNLRDIAATFDVGLARTVATLAGDAFAGMFESETGVRIRSKFLDHIRVTSGAGLLTDEIRRIHCRPGLGS
jgi:ABC-type phosphonate transport system ATPase subunit